MWYLKIGRVHPDNTLGEVDHPDEWMAAHYGWGHMTDSEGRNGRQKGEEDSDEDMRGAEDKDGEEEILPNMMEKQGR